MGEKRATISTSIGGPEASAGPGRVSQLAESRRLALVGQPRGVAGETKNGSGDESLGVSGRGGSPQHNSLENGRPLLPSAIVVID